MPDDLKRLRERESTQQAPDVQPPYTATPGGLFVSDANKNTKAGQFFAAHPAVILGDEVEGGKATIERDPDTTTYVFEPSTVPPAGSVFTASHVPYRWVRDTDGGGDPASLSLVLDYLAYTKPNAFTATSFRKSITLPLGTSRPTELGFLPTSYTLGTALGSLPSVRVTTQFGVSGHFLYDFALGWLPAESNYDGAALGSYALTGTPPVVVIAIHNQNAPNAFSMIFRTFGFHSFALAQIDGRWRLAHSIRLAKQHFIGEVTTTGQFPPTLGFGIDGAGFVVYRWGTPVLDEAGQPVIEFAAVDGYDYFDRVGIAYVRTSAPPDQSAAGLYLTATDGTPSTPCPTPWIGTSLFPAFATYRVRLYGL